MEERKDLNVHDEIHQITNKLTKVEELLNEVKEHFTNICVIHYAKENKSETQG